MDIAGFLPYPSYIVLLLISPWSWILGGNLNIWPGRANSSYSSFITYRSCRHLDGKHTIFGKVVGGIETLSKMERIEVDNKDKPIEDIKILVAHVFVDPFQEADDKLAAEREEEIERITSENKEKSKSLFTQTVFKAGVGKYIDPKALKSQPEENAVKEVPAKKKKPAGYQFSNFSNW